MFRGTRFIVTALLVVFTAGVAYAGQVGNGPSVVWGTKHNDKLNGHRGPDVIYGLRGDDKIITGKGGPGDKAYGGQGNDTLSNYSSGKSPGLLVGGPGRDKCIGNHRDTYVGCEVIEYR